MTQSQVGILPEPGSAALFLVLRVRDRAWSAHTLARAIGGVPALLGKVAALDRKAKLVATVGIGPELWDVISPAARPAGLRPFTAVSAGGSHSVAIRNTAPTALCQDVTVDADGTCSTAASIDNGSNDPDAGDSITLSQNPAGPYALGPTLVTLTVTDSHGASSTCTATVTVVDRTPPILGSCPANQVANATSPAGATVNYPATTATDTCGAPTVSYSQNSGTLFAIGDTTVTVTATDAANNQATCNFTVHVKGAGEQINDLFAKVNGLPGVKAATKNALVVKLQAALAALSAGNQSVACSALVDFINLCKAQKDKKLIPASSADELIADATRIKAALGCP